MRALRVDFSKPVRPVGKLNGMNNGPLHTFMDATAEFREMGVDFVRFHETHSPNIKCVEIPYIFRDMDADVNDPASYYFGETDAVMKAAHDEGIEIMYRLGMGTEGTKPWLFMFVPPDYEKWARIAEHIVMHYNEGWADGFHYGIKYWELGNECDLWQYFPGPRDEYTNLYCIMARILKDHDPSLKIGTCGFAWVFSRKPPARKLETEKGGYDSERGFTSAYEEWEDRVRFFNSFLARVRDEKVPMDFFGWHFYVCDSYQTEERIGVIDDLLKKYGFYGNVEVINTEWNNMHLARDPGGHWDFSQMVTMKCAVGCINSMIVMQKHGVTKAAYYDACPRGNFCGLYDYQHRLLRHAYSMKAVKMLREGETEVRSDGGTSVLRICASWNGKTGAVLLGNEGLTEEVRLDISNLPDTDYEVYLFDETHNLVPVETGVYTGDALRLLVGRDSAAVIRFTRKEASV